MDITYNGLFEPSADILTFTDVPNILKIQEQITGEKADITLYFEGNLRTSVTGDSQYYITILGETITNVMNPQNATNKRFYISGDEDATAMQVARALRNCSGIAAQFNIIHNGPEILLLAKTIGAKGLNNPNSIQRNIPSDKLTIEYGDGNAYSVLYNGKVDVDVYSGSTADPEKYVTTLEKNFYGDECAFDLSPVFATFSNFGITTPYQCRISNIVDNGEYNHLGYISGNTTVGYLANQSYKFLPTEGVQILLNNNRPIIRYTYDNMISMSLLCNEGRFGWDYTVVCRDSANNVVSQWTTIGRRTSDNLIVDSNAVVIPESAMADTYYVDVTVENATYRWNVIKPLKATEYYQRVYWRNEYGGIEFFDFTGGRSETEGISKETYEKNIFDLYDYSNYDGFELKKVYKNDIDKKVTLTSHLMEENGKYVFNSLAKSKQAWTFINGEKKYIIVENVEVNEDSAYNNIYTAKITYSYSFDNI